MAKEWSWGLRIATDARFGAGHVARSAALAAALPGRVRVFVDPGSAISDALDRFPCTVEASTESARLLLAAAGDGLDAAIFDSPAVADADIARAAKRGWAAAFRDGAPEGPEQIAIDLSPESGDGQRRLGGPGWAPLAPPFAAAHQHALRARREAGDPPRILVAFGARDSTNRTGLVVDALVRLGVPLAATVVLGEAFAHGASIEAAAERRTNLRLVGDAPDMSALYLSHDLAVGAPGVSQYERACCGLPTLLVAQNERQVTLAEAWAARGCALAAAATAVAVAAGLKTMIENRTTRQALRAAALATVDGRGAERLAAALAARAAG